MEAEKLYECTACGESYPESYFTSSCKKDKVCVGIYNKINKTLEKEKRPKWTEDVMKPIYEARVGRFTFDGTNRDLLDFFKKHTGEWRTPEDVVRLIMARDVSQSLNESSIQTMPNGVMNIKSIYGWVEMSIKMGMEEPMAKALAFDKIRNIILDNRQNV